MGISKMFEELQELGIITQAIPEESYWNDLASEKEDRELTRIMKEEAKLSEACSKTLDDLLHCNFAEAERTIKAMPLSKRIAILEDLNKHRAYLYNSISSYGEKVPLDEQVSAKTFRSVLGKIKHVEILQNWLYGIE
ncbi:MAG: hypothetical protein R3Y58_02040 [Eubacteriales bacterium]